MNQEFLVVSRFYKYFILCKSKRETPSSAQFVSMERGFPTRESARKWIKNWKKKYPKDHDVYLIVDAEKWI